MQLLDNYSLEKLNSFKIDVKARKFVTIKSNEEIIRLQEKGMFGKDRHLILGGGSNLLFTSDYDGTVVHMDTRGMEVTHSDDDYVYLRVMAGEEWDDVVGYCVERGWGGLENLSLIPGRAGSSPIQNIGAYGAELSDHFHSLEVLDKNTGKLREMSHEECSFSYRESVFKHKEKDRYIILSVTFRLDKVPRVCTDYLALSDELEDMCVSSPSISDVRKAVISIRRRKLPDPDFLGNAGSFFKNPVISRKRFIKLREEFPGIKFFEEAGGVKIAAGWLIEKAGWKGRRLGKAGVHRHQALVLVNHGGATGSEVLRLAEDIRASILDVFGIELQTEVNII